MSISDSDVQEEQRHFANVIATFQQYASYAVSELFQKNTLDDLPLFSLCHSIIGVLPFPPFSASVLSP